MLNNNGFYDNGALLSVGMVIIFSLLVSIQAVYAVTPYNVEGNRVFINDSFVYLAQEPHTVMGSGWVDNIFVSKNYSGPIDVAFGFDTEIVKPRSARLFDSHLVVTQRSYTCAGDFNYSIQLNIFWCYRNTSRNIGTNETPVWVNDTELVYTHYFDGGNLSAKTVFWNETHTEYYRDFTDRFSEVEYDYGGMDTWYVSEDLEVTAGEVYNLEVYLNIPLQLGRNSGKYWLCVKPSGKSIQEAREDGHLYCLDPWWNSTWGYRQGINITNNNATDALESGYTITFELDVTSLNSSGKALASGNNIRVAYDANATELDSINLTAWNTSTTNISFALQVDIAPGASDDENYSVYYGGPSGSRPEDESNIFIRTGLDMKALYHLDEGSGSSTSDLVNTSATGTITGATWTNTSRYGTALDFEKGDAEDRVSLDGSPAPIGNEGGVLVWFKSESTTVANMIVYDFADGTGDDNPRISVQHDTDNRIFHSVYDGVSEGNFSTTTVSDGTGVCVFTKWNDSGIYLYINGEYNTTSPEDAPWNLADEYTANIIGARFSEDQSWYDGIVDVFATFDSDLTDAEISDLCNYYPDYVTSGVIRKYINPEPTTSLLAEEGYDTAPPVITIDSPTNTTYLVTSVDLNYSVTEANLDSVWYSLDGASNVTTGVSDITTLYDSSGSSLGDEENITFDQAESNYSIYLRVPKNSTITTAEMNIHGYGGNYEDNFSVVSQISGIEGIVWNGSMFYVIGQTGTLAEVCEYYLNGTYSGNCWSISAGVDYDPMGIAWDAQSFFVGYRHGITDIVRKYYANWTYTGTNYNINEDGNIGDIVWDGVNFWLAGDNSDAFYKYYANWTYTGTNYSFLTNEKFPMGLTHTNYTLYLVGTDNDTIYYYDKNGNYLDISIDVGNEDGLPRGLTVREYYIYVAGRTSTAIYSYHLKLLNITVDTANDSIIDWSMSSELNSTNSPQTVSLNTTRINDYISTCTENANGYCFVGLNITSSTAGLLQVDTLSIDYYTSNLTLTSLSEGQHNVTVYANDSASNLNSSTQYFTVDTAPRITFQSPLNETTSDDTSLLNATFTDVDGNSINVNYTWFSVDGGTNSTLYGDTSNLTLNLSSLADGPHNVTVYANTSANNQLNSSTVYFTVDVTAPYLVNRTSPVANYNTSNNWVIFNFTCFDAVATTMTANLSIDGVVNVSDISVTNNTINSSNITLSEGNHNWSVVCWDDANNTNTSTTWNFTVDLSAPTFSTPTETGLSGTAVTITWTTNELTDTRLRYGTVSGTYTDESYNGANVTGHSVTLTSLTTSTTYYYVLNATDMASPDPNVAQSAEYSFTTLSGGVGSPGGGGGGPPPLVTPEPEIIVVEPIITFLENQSEEFIRNNFFDDILGYSEAVNALVDFQDYNIPVAMFTVFGWEVGETIGVESEVANLLGAGVIFLLVGGVYISRNWKVEFGGPTMLQKRETRRVKRDGILKGLSKARDRLHRDLGLEEERKKVYIRREKTMDVRRRNLQEKREMLAGRKKIVFKKKE